MKGYRTIVFNIVMMIAMIMKQWWPEAEVPGEEAINEGLDTIEAALAFIWGIGNAGLRAVTNTPIFSSKKGTAKSPAIVGILAIILSLMVVSGCAGTRSAYKAAEGIDETAYVMTKHWEFMLVQADRLAADGILTGSAKTTAQAIAREGTPFILSMKEARDAYVNVKSASNEADLQIALNRAVIYIGRMTRILQRGGNRNISSIPNKDPPSWGVEGIPLAAAA